nr:MAG TPA: hypothetical protein [Caudoviricetes sp.]
MDETQISHRKYCHNLTRLTCKSYLFTYTHIYYTHHIL